MSARPLHDDRPPLRLFKAPPEPSGLTIRSAYEQFLIPEIAARKQSTRDDYARFVSYWEEFEASQRTDDPRTIDPWVLTEITTRAVTMFTNWLLERELSASTADKAMKAIRRIVTLAGQEGADVNAIRTKSLRPKPAPKHYIADDQLGELWASCDAQAWPSRGPNRSFAGSGLDASTFWRAVLVLLRSYGMRVQDLVAYDRKKSPITWGDVTFSARSPNPEGRADSPLGWLHYTASKTGREYYLPLTPLTRAALDRLLRAAMESLGVSGLEQLPKDRAILPCPSGHGLGNHWKSLQRAASVEKPGGGLYALEDFRKTCATYLDEHAPELAYLVCGWSTAGSAVAHRHYINSELKLVKLLPTVPTPPCFADWLK